MQQRNKLIYGDGSCLTRERSNRGLKSPSHQRPEAYGQVQTIVLLFVPSPDFMRVTSAHEPLGQNILMELIGPGERGSGRYRADGSS